jgi:hypothetical protein
MALDQHALGAVCDADDIGPLAELFAGIAELVSAALGPSLKSEGVGKKDKLEPGDPLRIEMARWMGALGFDDFDVYVGGRNPTAVVGVAAERPTLVVGSKVQAPLDAAGRAAVAREAFALRRGICSLLHCDDHTIRSIVASVSIASGVPTPAPPYAVFKEVDRAIVKVMNRRVRKLAAALGQGALDDVGGWVAAARRSIDRMALIAAGDASVVIDAIVGPRGRPARAAWQADPRPLSLLRFALSSDYLELRKKLGMGIK